MNGTNICNTSKKTIWKEFIMEKIFLVEDNKLDVVNQELAKGGTVKLIQAVSAPPSNWCKTYAYVVISYPDWFFRITD